MNHRQQCRDVVYQHLKPCLVRLKFCKSQQVKGCCQQHGHRAGALAAVAVGVLIELSVPDPLPVLDAPADTHKLQQFFWGGEEMVGGQKWLTLTWGLLRK